MRQHLLDSEQENLTKAIKEIEDDDLMHQYDVDNSYNLNDGEIGSSPSTKQNGVVMMKRRAAVFYVDKNDGVIAYINWWIFSWKFIGNYLNECVMRYRLANFKSNLSNDARTIYIYPVKMKKSKSNQFKSVPHVQGLSSF